MGKKGKKTRWRELPITSPADKPYAAQDQPQQQLQQQQQQQSNRQSVDAKPVNFAAAAGRRSHHAQHQQQYHHQQQQQQQQQHPHQSLNRNYSLGTGQQRHHVESSTVTFNEDEYTKITTPRQDVLFKKGYLGRRKHASVPVITEIINENEDGVSADINPLDEMMCAPGEYVDPSAMYILNGGGYEVYDPYTGNPVTVLMGPPPGHYPTVGGHPILAAMPYQPMPMQALDWYNPANPTAGEHWLSPPVYQSNRHHHQKKSCSSDVQQNCAVQNSDATNGVQETSSTDDQQSLYQPALQPYGLYPGYMFPTPLYNFNGVSIQVPQPLQSPPSPSVSCDYANGKRRKKKKRRKRGGVTDEYSDSSSEEQKSQSGASSDLVPDSGKTSDSGVQTNNSGGSTPVNVTPAVQLSHNAPPFHMECARPFEIVHGVPPVFVHHHTGNPMTAYYHQPIPQYAEPHRPPAPVGYQAVPEEAHTAAETAASDGGEPRPDGEPAAGYSAENSDSGISSPNSEVAATVKGSGLAENKHEKPPLHKSAGGGGGGAKTDGGAAAQTAPKKSRNKKSGNKQRDKAADSSAAGKSKCNKDQVQQQQQQQQQQKNHHREGGKKSSKIAKEPAIIKMLNAKKAARGCCKPEPETAAAGPACTKSRKRDDDDDDDDGEREESDETPAADQRRVAGETAQLTIGATADAAEWTALQQDEEPFCSLECTPRSTADHVQFQFAKTMHLSVDSCESAEEETFATAVNGTGGNSDTENELNRLQDEPDSSSVTVTDKIDSDGSSPANVTATTAAVPALLTPAGPITEAVTKWLNDQGGLMLAVPRADDVYDGSSTEADDDDDDDDDDGDSEYDDFDEHSTVSNSPKNVRSNPYPALSRSNGSRVAGPSSPSVSALPSSNDQRKTGLVSSGICCLTQ